MAQRHVSSRLGCVRQDRADILAVDVLHRDEVISARLTDIVDLDDVLVMKVRYDPRLIEKHSDEALVLCLLRPDPLEHDMALEAFNPVSAAEEDIRHTS